MIIADENAMSAYGEQLAKTLAVGDWVAIDGPLGAGKTVLCKGILRGLGFGGEVTSPSYAIVHHYSPPETSIAVAHADLYRLNHVEELDEIGLAEERDGCVTLVEWAERGGANYMKPSHHIQIAPQPDGSRILTLKMDTNDTGK
ncbi:MAG: tRNA (adenosine(37)-N6)-threonylcarbamoyltransferase complex ATPase subunit type 1 TsaE [Sphingorhabdus sp.]